MSVYDDLAAASLYPSKVRFSLSLFYVSFPTLMIINSVIFLIMHTRALNLVTELKILCFHCQNLCSVFFSYVGNGLHNDCLVSCFKVFDS